MRFGVLCLTACLVTATCGQFLTAEHFITNLSDALNNRSTESPVDRNSTLNNDHKTLNSSIANSSASYRDLNSADQADDLKNSANAPYEQSNESSISRESGPRETTSVENPPNLSSEGIGSENTSDNESSEGVDSIPNSSVKSESQDSVADVRSSVSEEESNARISSEESTVRETEEESNANLSADSSGDSQNPPGVSGESGPGLNPDGQNLSNDDERIEQTTHGPVKGHKWKDTDIYAFMDIPYGKVETPFQAPNSAQSWIDVHEVEEHSARCPQYQDGFVGDLNCLTLSIFVPAEVVNASVFFYVHDSGFHSGDPMIYGPEHIVSKGVILVLPNYRIGVLGFLCLQNETAPGNAGLKDLSEALQWTKNNIDRFGGNSLNIVVGGDGDAGALVGYLALCSPSKSNIDKVITESGSILSHLALDRHPVITAGTLAGNIRNVMDEVIYNNTFAEAPLQIIVEAAKGMRFNPCIEHDKEPFIDASPWTLLQNKEINITFMIGSASHAGTHEAVAMTHSFIDQLNADYGLILPEDLLFSSREARDKHAMEIKYLYFGNGTITPSQVEQLSLLSTDISYLGPLIRSARPLAEAGATVYLYEFEFVGKLNRELISLKQPVEGAVRSDIIGYLFTQAGHVPEEGTPEEHMIGLILDLWVSFIETGKPAAGDVIWEKMKVGEDTEEEFLHIVSDPKIVKGVHLDRLQLWTRLYDEFFIERNFALSLTPGYYVFITIILWITNIKLD